VVSKKSLYDFLKSNTTFASFSTMSNEEHSKEAKKN
jgi:hypothetical protein